MTLVLTCCSLCYASLGKVFKTQSLVACRPFVYQNQLHVSYALDIFDKALNVTEQTRSDEHKMRFQGSGFARVDLETLELHSLINFDQPLIPRREVPAATRTGE